MRDGQPNDSGRDSVAEPMERLRPWLAAHTPGADALTIHEAVAPSQGFSSRTILFKAAWREQGTPRERALVARIQRETTTPMLGDVFHQCRVMRAVAAASEVAVPHIAFAEEDPGVLGAPFFLMDRVEGRVPSDFPSYHAEGWVADLAPGEREQAWWNGVREMERLHRISWRQFPFLSGGVEEPPDAAFYLKDFVGRWFGWASQGRAYPVIEDAMRFLLANAPVPRRSGLVWNDARMGNTMFRRDLGVASLFDFEVASLGPPEVDLAHWLYLDDIFSIQFGVERLPGIPKGEAAVRGFERIYGWPMPDFDYYMAVAALKILVISIRDYSNDKLMNAPEVLPGFLLSRLEIYLDQYRYLLSQP